MANSTVGRPVFREDGTRVYGFDAELELKKQSKRDKGFEGQLLAWIETVTHCKCKHPENFSESLRSGVLLCKMLNAIESDTISTSDTDEQKKLMKEI